VIWTFLLTTSIAHAQPCSLYQLTGEVLQSDNVTLTVNPKSNSQRTFVAKARAEMLLAAYSKRFITGKFVIRGLEILSAEDVKFAVPDPLFHSQGMQKLSEVSCDEQKKRGPKAP
jgi:hypothetical protein